MNLPAEGSYREKLCRDLEYGRDCTIVIGRLRPTATVCERSVTRSPYHEKLPGIIDQSDSLIHDFVPLRCMGKKIKVAERYHQCYWRLLYAITPFQESDHVKSIFSYLTGKQISKACHTAQEHGDYRLSLLLSQVTGNSVTRNLVYKQLADWQELKVRLAL